MEIEKMLKETKKAYDEIIAVLNKHVDIVHLPILDLEQKAMKHLFGLELKEKYGFNIDPRCVTSLDYMQLGNYDYLHLSRFGNGRAASISWEDNGRQPKNEVLLQISFPTGAYIFGFGRICDKEYPKEFFQEFWQELKSYNPKYIDTANHNLYFAMNNAGKIFNEFDGIYKKYREKNKEDFKKREVKRLEKEIESLKA